MVPLQGHIKEIASQETVKIGAAARKVYNGLKFVDLNSASLNYSSNQKMSKISSIETGIFLFDLDVARSTI